MMRIPLSWRSAALSCALLALGSPVQGAAPLSNHPKLGKELAPIAEAAARHAEIPLMTRALVHQAVQGYSPFEPHWNSLDQVQVYLHYDPERVTPDVAALKNLGADDIKVVPSLKVIQAWVPAGELDAVAQLDGVTRVGLPRYALHRAAPAFGPRPQIGSVTTQGDQILGSASFRSTTGIDGQGISVGVISDGADHISESQNTGDLPANIWKDPNFGGKGDEGTAMMEIVYDLAPGVKQLGFCGPNTTADFLTCLDDFNKDIGANVIVDDLAFPGGAMFSDDNFNTGIRNFVNAHPNTRLVAATGNDGTDYWQGTWVPHAVSTSVNHVSYTQAEDFGGGTPYLQIAAPAGDKIAYLVEWNDPWSDSSTTNDPNDYDVVVFDNSNSDGSNSGTGHLAVACNQGMNVSGGTLCNQTNSQPTSTPGPQPVQGSQWTAAGVSGATTNYYLEVFLNGGSPGPNLKILVFDVSNPMPVPVTPVTAGSVYGHAALPSPNEISVGAVYAPDALVGSYNIESYSSLGPVEYGVTGGTAQTIQKPDFVAPDCVSVTGAGGFRSPFCGTSAAAPHIAGLLALLMQGYPSLAPYTLLQKAATQPQPGLGTPNNGTYGYGIPIITSLLSAGYYPVPAAKITSPANGTTLTAGQSETFSGSCTADKAVGSLTADWNFGTGSGIADSSASAPSVSFANTGTYTVTLKCTGSTGSGSTSISVTVKAPSSSGGGSLDLFSLAALGLWAAARRRSIQTN